MSQLANTGAPTPRRSNRLSKAGSVASQSVMTAVTASGSKSARKGPLTKVKARASNAYGASGRIGAAEELTVNATGFSQAFQNQRGDAVARDNEPEEDDVNDLESVAYYPTADDLFRRPGPVSTVSEDEFRMSGALNGIVARQERDATPARSRRGAAFVDSADRLTSDAEGNTTSAIDTSKSFGENHEAGMISKSNQERTNAVDTTAASHFARHEPWSQIFNDQQAVRDPLPRRQPVHRPTLEEAVQQERARLQRDGPPQPRPQQQIRDPNPLQVDLPSRHEFGLPDDAESAHNWYRYVKWASFLIVLFAMLCAAFAAGQYDYDGTNPSIWRVINMRAHYQWDSFKDWIAPQSRYGPDAKYPPGVPNEDYDVMWDRMRRTETDLDDVKTSLRRFFEEKAPNYIVVNRKKSGEVEIPDELWKALASKFRAEGMGGNGDAAWDEFIKNNNAKVKELLSKPIDITNSQLIPTILQSKELVDRLEQNYEQMSKLVDKRIAEAIESMTHQMKTVAAKEARKVSIDQIRMGSLALTNLAHNMELTLSKVNYFSSGLGANIDPYFTSASVNSGGGGLMSSFVKRLAVVPPRLPPMAALQKWEEPGDCWCSAPDETKSGKAQLGVNIPHPMFPEQVTIEHAPKAIIPKKKIANAPRDIELWVQTDARPNYHFTKAEHACDDDGPEGFVCLGKFKYDIHGSNHVQTFNLDAESTVPIKKAVVRIVNNWGADHTCLYRVRLHGHDTEPEHEYKINN